MTAIMVPISEERLKHLRQLAESQGVTAEQLAQAGLEDWLLRSHREFEEAARHVLEKNRDLYKRLA